MCVCVRVERKYNCCWLGSIVWAANVYLLDFAHILKPEFSHISLSANEENIMSENQFATTKWVVVVIFVVYNKLFIFGVCFY